ncbi:MAG: OmpA family protein [Gammaproteobacteria bacterium]|nr:OmpA family protein [Gammaproteobacteria bacterium]
MKRQATLMMCLVIALATLSCATDEFGNRRPLTNTEKGAMIGVGAGALVGYLARKDHKGKGALIGAVGGGLAGGAVGAYMDSQRKDLEKALAAEVKSGAITIEKKDQDTLMVTMTAHTSFDSNSSEIKPGFHSSLDKIADVLVRYGKTYLVIIGHTDNVGTTEYNQALSERRSGAVREYLQNQGVVPQRLEIIGKGETEPRAANTKEEGRSLNRRVEILIEPVVHEAGQG